MPAPPPAPDPRVVAEDVARALAEDVGDGDLTACLVPGAARLATTVICRETAVLAGRPWFDGVFERLGGVEIDWICEDGQSLEPGQRVCRLEGPARAILTGERSALNFIQTLSGTATATRAYVDAVAGQPARVLDTRKTLPGLRQAQKYAVRCGGGHNHRLGLFDAILIKENHICAAGSIGAAVRAALASHPGLSIEVEVESLSQLDEAVAAGAPRALLDNFGLVDLRRAVERHGEAIELEASGEVRLETISDIAATGVDFISTGAITKHVRAVDFSMRFVA